MRFDRWVQREVAVAAAAALVAGLVVGSSVTWVATRSRRSPTVGVVTGPASPTPSANPVGQGIYTVVSADQSGTISVVAPGAPGITVTAGMQQGSSIVRSYDGFAYLDGASGTAYLLSRPFLGVPRSLGRAGRLFPAEDAGLVGLQSGSGGATSTVQLVPDHPGAALARGPFVLPAGWDVVSEASDGLVLLQHPAGQLAQQLRLWVPGTGFARTFSTSVRDVIGMEGDTLAWRSVTGCDAQTTECPLHITSMSDGRDSTVQPPDGHHGFLGGGAVSPDTNEVAAFVYASPPGKPPTAQLAMVTRTEQYIAPEYQSSRAGIVVVGSTVQVGEPFGFAVWSPDSQRVFFCGLGPFMHAYSPNAAAAETLTLPASTAFTVF